MTVLEQLLSNPDRIRLLRFALLHPEEDFTTRELQQRLGRRVQERQVRELNRLGCFVIGFRPDSGATSYRIDPGWLLFPEFRALFMKAQLLVEHDLVRRLQQTGRLQLLILTGLFVGEPRGATDALLVGSTQRQRVGQLFRQFERDLNTEVKYTIMTAVEYRYRKDIGDRFIYDILEGRHLVVVDTMERRAVVRTRAVQSRIRPRIKKRNRLYSRKSR